jgi:hypothetical protein
VLGATAVAIGVCVTLSADAQAADAQADSARTAPLVVRLREANDSLRRLQTTDYAIQAPAYRPDAIERDGERGGDDARYLRWTNYWVNFNPWRNWNNWNNWHNFNQWANL